MNTSIENISEPIKAYDKIKNINWLFILTVIIPTLLAIAYFGFIASDVYISESRFVVRSPDKQNASPFSSFLKGTGFSSSQDDSYTVKEYMLSRDALSLLNDKLSIKEAYSSKDVDIFSRFSGLAFWDTSFEALYQYYINQVVIELDSDSSITTLTIKSFTAEDAYHINEQLIQMNESLVNKLNEVAKSDMIGFATQEVNIAEQKAQAAALELSSYRNQKGVVDPEKQSGLELEQVVKLQNELITAQAKLVQLQTFAKENPQIPSLQLKIKSLESEIATQTKQVVGGDQSLAKKAAQYQRLALEREFADKQLASTLASLELARNEAMRKQLYLERIVQPNLPDYPIEPRRLRGILTSFIMGMTAWGVLSILLAGVREHND